MIEESNYKMHDYNNKDNSTGKTYYAGKIDAMRELFEFLK